MNVAALVGIVVGWLLSKTEYPDIVIYLCLPCALVSSIMLIRIGNHVCYAMGMKSNIAKTEKTATLITKKFSMLVITSLFIFIAHQQLTTTLPLALKVKQGGRDLYMILLVLNLLLMVAR